MGGDCLDDNEVAELFAGGLDASRRARVDAHLDGCAGCRTLVAELAMVATEDPHGTMSVPPPAPTAGDDSRELQAGDRIDHFEVLGRLGHGGMADVYEARDPTLDRTVALKLIRDELLGSADARARFEREARATARFNHPNIITIHAVGEHDGRPYVALERLEGETLADRLRAGPLDGATALSLGLAIAEALSEAHAHGVLHRDLKPHNVHIDIRGHVRVLDFGLAKLVATEEPRSPDGDGSAETSIDVFQTRAGGISGTPTTMAPEQWRGQGESAATDVWALGVILYTALSGQSPLRGDSAKALSREALSSTPLAGLGTVAPDVPRAWAALVDACLAKQSRLRPSTSAVADRLREAIVALEHPPARSPWWRGLAMGAVGVVVIAVGWWSLMGTPASEAPASRQPEPSRGGVSVEAAPATPASSPSTLDAVAEPVLPPRDEPATVGDAVPEPDAAPAPDAREPRTPDWPARGRKARPRPTKPPGAAKDALFGTRE